MPTKVSICVYVGEPLDFTQYRHTALFLEFPGGVKRIMHVTGTHREFVFEQKPDCNPEDIGRLAKKIPVAEIPDSIDPGLLTTVISNTRIRNGVEDSDWNCHNWVGDAMARAVKSGFMTASQREEAVGKMLDVCLEAADEEQPE